VIIAYAPTSSDNYLLQLDGCSWVSFDHIGFMLEEGDLGRIVELINEAHHNTFSYNYFQGLPTTSSSSNRALVFSGNTLEHENTFSNNLMEQGSYAFYLSGQNSSNLEKGNRVVHNILKGQRYHSIYAQYQEAFLIDQNQITEGSNNSSYVGIYIYQCQNQTEITANNLYDVLRGRGIYLTSSSAEVGKEILVANNFIHVGDGNNEGYGLEISSCTNVNVFHNNIHIVSNNANSFAFRSNQSSGSKVLNNIFVTSEEGKAYDKNGGFISASNFNDLFSGGSNLGSWDGTLADDLEEWKMVSGLDAGSFNVDPIFSAPNDLHVSEVDLNGTAFPIAVITTDIDGETRNKDNPDIGADEFSPIVANDAGIVGLEQPNAQVPFPAGEQEIRAIVKNNGYDTISSVDIYWKINNNPKPKYSWEGNLMPGTRDTVVLGSFNFEVGVGHTILAYTKDPEGQPDGDISNDTFFVTDLYPGLIGTYTIGGEIPDFNSLSEAAKAINEGGMLGPVQFAIRNGIYNEQIEIEDLKGIGAENTFTLQSESMDADKVTISYDGQQSDKNYIIKIDDTDFTTIQNLTFETGNQNYATAIELINGSDHVAIKQNVFRAETNYADAIIRSHPISLDHHLLISENEFIGAGYGVVLQGQGPTLKEEGTRIMNNVFQDQRNAAVYTNYQNDIKIINNEISTTKTYRGYFGIFCSYVDGFMEIRGNKIYGGEGHGIWLDRFT